MNKRKFKRSKKAIRKIKFRELSEYENNYLDELKKFDKVLSVAMLISKNQHGISTTGRGIRAANIFTRQTLAGMSLRSILPYPADDKHKEEELWDIGSIASIARNILEGFLSIYYFGTENVSDEEAELRFFILQQHRNQEWYSIRKQFNPDDPELVTFEKSQEEQKNRITNHTFLNQLTPPQKNKALRGHEIYKTKADFEACHKACEGLKLEYQLLSNFIHPLPLSIERIDNVNGRGIGSDADINYCIMALVIARKYFAASTIEIADFFKHNLYERFKNEVDSIRFLVSK